MKPLLIISIIIASFVLSGCTTQTAPTQDNPAYIKCINNGGQDKITYGPNGQVDLCLFSDGSVCGQEAYYYGRCSKGSCMRKCDAIGTRSEGWYDCNEKLLFYDNCGNETAATAGSC